MGAASVALFKSKGYKVASVARTIRDEVAASSDLVLTADFSDPSAIKGVFEKVEQQLGVPNVVIYNREHPSEKLSLFYAIERVLLKAKPTGVQNKTIANLVAAYSWSAGPDPANPVSAPVESFQKDLATNTVSVYAAAQAAVEGFDKLPHDTRKTFIYTGNCANTCVSCFASHSEGREIC